MAGWRDEIQGKATVNTAAASWVIRKPARSRESSHPGGRNLHAMRLPAIAAQETVLVRGQFVLNAWGQTDIGVG